MRIERLVLRGFALYQDETVEFPHPGLVYVYGENGTGKTALIEAVSFALWGKSIRRQERGGTWSPWTGGGDSRVLADVVLLSGERVHIERGPSHLDVQVQGRSLVGATLTDTQARLESLLGEHRDFLLTSVFAHAQVAGFSRGTDAERGAWIDRVRGLDGWDEMAETAQSVLRESVQVVQRASSFLSEQQALQAAAHARVESCQARLAETDRGTDDELFQKAESAQAQVAAAQREVAQARAEHRKQNEASFEKTAQACKEQVMRQRTEIEGLQRQVVEQDSRITHAQTMAGQTCPTCLQLVSRDQAPGVWELHRRQLDEIRKGIRQKETELAEKVTRWKAAQKEEEAWRQTLQEGQEWIRRAEQAHEDLEEVWRQLQPEVEEARQRQVRREELQRLLEEAEGEVAATVESVDSALEQEQTALREERIARAVAACYGVQGLRTQLRQDALGVLQGEANRYLHRLGADWQLRLEASRTAKSSGRVSGAVRLAVEGGPGGGVLYGCSEGQIRRADLALLLGVPILRRTDRAFRTLFFDEVLDILDEEGVERAAELLTELAESATLLCVSHSTALRSLFPMARQTWQVTLDAQDGARVRVVS